MLRKRLLIIGLALVIVGGGVSYHLLHRPLASVAPVVKPKSVAKPTNSAVAFNKTQYSLTDPSSRWVVVNKHRPLQPADYAPSDLVVPTIPMRSSGMQVRPMTALALQTMFTDAKTSGINLKLASGYRSYNYQVNLYNGYVKTQGQAVADTQSARPGYSEHQTGLAADIGDVNGNCTLQQCFGTTNAGQWLAANAYRYGFIIRYGQGLTATTGYSYEPWHVRYIGTELSTELHTKNVLTLEEFFELGAAPDYP